MEKILNTFRFPIFGTPFQPSFTVISVMGGLRGVWNVLRHYVTWIGLFEACKICVGVWGSYGLLVLNYRNHTVVLKDMPNYHTQHIIVVKMPWIIAIMMEIQSIEKWPYDRRLNTWF